MIFSDYVPQPWELRNQYYKTIEMSDDVKEISKVLQKANAKQNEVDLTGLMEVENNILNQNKEVLSNIGTISEIVSSNNLALQDINDGILSLKSAFEIGISEVVWQLERQNKQLKSILDVLRLPIDTRAKELRHRAEESLKNGWYPEAYRYFRESQAENLLDFTIHINMGLLLLFHNSEICEQRHLEKSQSCFELAARYAKPLSEKKYCAISTFYLAYVCQLQNDIDNALVYYARTIFIQHNFSQALFQSSVCYSIKGDIDNAVRTMRKAIEFDPLYILRIKYIKEFNPKVLNEFRIMIANLRDLKILEMRSIFIYSVKEYESIEVKLKGIIDNYCSSGELLLKEIGLRLKKQNEDVNVMIAKKKRHYC